MELTHPANSFLLHVHLRFSLVCSFACLSLQEWMGPNEERGFEWTMFVYLTRILLIYTLLTFSAWPSIRILACPFRMHFRKKAILIFWHKNMLYFFSYQCQALSIENILRLQNLMSKKKASGRIEVSAISKFRPFGNLLKSFYENNIFSFSR